YQDLVVPLKKSCPAAMDVLNREGLTPGDLLGSMKMRQQCPGAEEENETAKGQADREWYQKLSAECEAEFYTQCGRYEGEENGAGGGKAQNYAVLHTPRVSQTLQPNPSVPTRYPNPI
ncbi:hypothetical protein chiPu_0024893, partial [Chiloscyllium punctatum]|nr:hypothetical protein [Chiloscyllium punctatum]